MTIIQQVLTVLMDAISQQDSEWMDSSEACKTLSCSASQLRRAWNEGVFSSDAVVNVGFGTGRPTYRFQDLDIQQQF